MVNLYDLILLVTCTEWSPLSRGNEYFMGWISMTQHHLDTLAPGNVVLIWGVWLLNSLQWFISWALRWCHNDPDGVSNHWCIDCLLNHLFQRRSKKTSKLRITGLCKGNSPITGEFPAQRASNKEKCFHLMTSSGYILWNYNQANARKHYWWQVNSVSGNVLVPSGAQCWPRFITPYGVSSPGGHHNTLYNVLQNTTYCT